MRRNDTTDDCDTKLSRAFSDPAADRVPASLRPENIGVLLKKCDDKVIRFPIKRIASVAAAFVIMLAAAIMLPQSGSGAGSDAATGVIGGYAMIEDVFTRLSRAEGNNTYRGWAKSDDMQLEGAEVPNATESPTASLAATSEAASPESTDDDYSSTNVQVDGVDEADILKTDGKYIYFVTGLRKQPYYGSVTSVNIAAADNGQLEHIWTYCNKEWKISDIFIYNNKLVLLMSSHSDYYRKYFYEDTAQSCRIEVFDISDPENPIAERSFEQDGSYNTARLTDGKLLLISTKVTYYYDICKYNGEQDTVSGFDPETVIPKTCDSAVGDEAVILPSERCYVFPQTEDTSFTVVSLLDLDAPLQAADSLTVMGAAGTVYANTENLYIASAGYEYQNADTAVSGMRYPYWWYTGDYTTISKISMAGGKLSVIANGKVHGRLCSQFAMDEYEGNLRVATNYSFQENRDTYNYLTTNNFYVLDGDMKIIGSLEGLAKDENMYSVRFSGSTVYAVTYRQVDPFFVINLSDPTRPYVEGELKIPGFSQYLHPYDGNLVIGFGMDSEEYDNGSFALTKGFKVAMFDVADPQNPQELTTMYIGDRGTTSVLSHDHRSLLYDKAKNLISFPITITQLSEDANSIYDYGKVIFDGYIILGYNPESGFFEKGRVTHVEAESELFDFGYGTGVTDITRACYIGDVIYTLSDNQLRATSMSDWKEISRIVCDNAGSES